MMTNQVSPNITVKFHDAMTDLLLKNLVVAGEPLSADYLACATDIDRDKINEKLRDCKYAYMDHMGRWTVNFDE